MVKSNIYRIVPIGAPININGSVIKGEGHWEKLLPGEQKTQFTGLGEDTVLEGGPCLYRLNVVRGLDT